MHLRRALLLFAIVLMVAALAATLAPSDKAPSRAKPPPAAARHQPQAATEHLTIDGRSGRRQKQSVKRGTHVILSIPVTAAGEVRIGRLDLTAAAEPSTPASFDFIAERPGDFAVSFQPPRGEAQQLGTLAVAQR